MQYEAKCSNGGGNTATNGGYPWNSCTSAGGTVVSASAGEPITDITQIQAKAACESIGAHLITNAEWMAIARDIEQVASNWTGGAVGSGMIKRGNVALSDAGSYDGANPEVGVTDAKAKLKLSNGKEIYHLSGNVYEWVDDTIETSQIPTPTGWQEYSASIVWNNSYLPRQEAGPLNVSYNATTHGVGRIYLDPDAASPSGDKHAFLRSLYWDYTSDAGVFALSLHRSPSNSLSIIGFRCAR